MYIVLVLVGLMLMAPTGASAQKKMKKEAVLWAAEDLKWGSAARWTSGRHVGNVVG